MSFRPSLKPGWFLQCAAIAVLLCLPSCVLKAAPAPDPPGDSHGIVLAGDSNYPPYQFITPDGRATGFDVELFRTVAGHLHVPLQVELGNWASTRQALAAGRVDVVPMLVTPEREKLYLFTTPFLYRYHLVFGRRGSGFVHSFHELGGRRVAAQYEGVAWTRLQPLNDVRIVPTQTEPAAIDMLRQGKADYAVVPMMIGYSTITHGQDAEIVALSPPLLEMPYAYAVSRDRPALVGRIDKALAQVKRDGTYDRLYLQWLGNLEPPSDSFRHGLLIAALTLVPLLLFLLWWLRHSRLRAQQETARRRELERDVDYLAYNDPDTGLPNQHGFLRQLGYHLEHADKPRVAVIRIDLLDLDTLRAVAGDAVELRLLKALGARLDQSDARWWATCLAPGKFALVVQSFSDPGDVVEIVQAALGCIQARLDLGGLPIEQPCCAGVALYPDHAPDPAGLLRAASMACSAAPARRTACVFYDAGLEPDPRSLTLVSELREAMESGSLDWAVQPKVDLRSQRLVGVEVLTRWNHPVHGALAPDEFLPLAEPTGLLRQLTEYVVRQVADYGELWAPYGPDFHIAVNASVNDLADDDVVATIIDANGVSSFRLVIEVTESEQVRDADAVLRSLRRLKAAGIEIALDDFGTGYSSLNYLKRMAPDEVKIDQSFVRDVVESTTDRAIVQAAINLAHSLGARVCAEGIEDDAMLAWLREAGCDLGQGFALGRPMPPEALASWHLPSGLLHVGDA